MFFSFFFLLKFANIHFSIDLQSECQPIWISDEAQVLRGFMQTLSMILKIHFLNMQRVSVIKNVQVYNVSIE